MLADLSKLAPIRDTPSSSGAPRRRQDKTSTQKVLPRRENQGSGQEEKAGQERGRGLNAYV
ncbi:MAG: hypothetical protein V1806_17525 [Pseudomonadota bacterium]